MGRSLHVRLDERSTTALDLIKREGLTDSEAVRLALLEAAERRDIRALLRADAQRIAADEADLEEVRVVRELLEELEPDGLL
jgi:hypothetical protein